MYKVFFNDRIIFLVSNIEKCFNENEGLFFRFDDQKDMGSLITWFEKNTHCKKIYVFSEDITGMQAAIRLYFTFIKAAGGLVKNKKGEVLAIRRRGMWDLPKGKAEDNEDDRSAAIREVKEETGIKNADVTKEIISTYHTYQLDGKRILKKTAWFEMFSVEEQVVPQKEEDISEVRWMSAADLPEFISNTYLSVVDVLTSAGLITVKNGYKF